MRLKTQDLETLKSLEMLKTYLHGQSLEGFDPSSRAGSREYPTPKIISVG
jgi:hypothetical protein